jgi:DNA-binding NtrC family response regulator
MPSTEDLALLVSYPWPGNVRELAAVIDRAAILGNGERLEIATSLGTASPVAAPRPAPEPPADVPVGRLAPLDVAIRQHIESALAATLGRIEGRYGAAKLLQINPHTLRARMRKLGIDRGQFSQ